MLHFKVAAACLGVEPPTVPPLPANAALGRPSGALHDLWRWHGSELLGGQGVGFAEFAKCVKKAERALATCAIVAGTDPAVERCKNDDPLYSHLLLDKGFSRSCVDKLLVSLCTSVEDAAAGSVAGDSAGLPLEIVSSPHVDGDGAPIES